MPVGVGKALCAESVARATGGHIITPTNLLINQYSETYSQKNFLKGKSHYNCHTAPVSCEDWQQLADGKACSNCPYTIAKKTAHRQPTFFNPMSYYYFTLSEEFKTPKVLIVDEAHMLVGALMGICGVSLKSTQYPFRDEYKDELTLLRWLDYHINNLDRLKALYKSDKVRLVEVSREQARLCSVAKGLRESAENYAIWTEDHTTGRGRHKKSFKLLHIKPVTLPRGIAKKLLSTSKVVLLSGTLFETDVKELIGEQPYLYKDFASPIDKARRQILYDPVTFPMNYKTDPLNIVNAVKETITRYSNNNATLVHTTYGLNKKLKPLLNRAVIVNEIANDKEDCLDKFKSAGGVFYAAGCAEGIDLKGDLCRLNIIPKLMFPDLKDPVVAKRKALQDGQEWYAMCVFKTLIQQIGRSTRGSDDWSLAVIKDPNFSRLFKQWSKKLPQSFKEALVWSPSSLVSLPPVDQRDTTPRPNLPAPSTVSV